MEIAPKRGKKAPKRKLEIESFSEQDSDDEPVVKESLPKQKPKQKRVTDSESEDEYLPISTGKQAKKSPTKTKAPPKKKATAKETSSKPSVQILLGSDDESVKVVPTKPAAPVRKAPVRKAPVRKAPAKKTAAAKDSSQKTLFEMAKKAGQKQTQKSLEGSLSSDDDSDVPLTKRLASAKTKPTTRTAPKPTAKTAAPKPTAKTAAPKPIAKTAPKPATKTAPTKPAPKKAISISDDSDEDFAMDVSTPTVTKQASGSDSGERARRVRKAQAPKYVFSDEGDHLNSDDDSDVPSTKMLASAKTKAKTKPATKAVPKRTKTAPKPTKKATTKPAPKKAISISDDSDEDFAIDVSTPTVTKQASGSDSGERARRVRKAQAPKYVFSDEGSDSD